MAQQSVEPAQRTIEVVEERDLNAPYAPATRVDAPLKVVGAADYAADRVPEDALYCVLVCSPHARARIVAIDAAAALAAAGVVAVESHLTMPRIAPVTLASGEPLDGGRTGETLQVLQTPAVLYVGQVVAAVVAESAESAREGAARLRIDYDVETPIVRLDDPRAPSSLPPDLFGEPLQIEIGDPGGALAAAPHRVRSAYTTPILHAHPLEPHAIVASFRDDHLTVHTTSQWTTGARNVLAAALELPREQVRVLTRYVGGGFGTKGTLWSFHIALAAIARRAQRPVKLVLTRRQLSWLVGRRPATSQVVELGADADGTLLAVRHDTVTETSRTAFYVEFAGLASSFLYRCPNLSVRHRLVELDLSAPKYIRAPGEATGLFALESALDELASDLRIDPLQLRLRNRAPCNQVTGQPWSSNHLEACYRIGADRIGWDARRPDPTARVDATSEPLIGYGMATATFTATKMDAAARVTLDDDGDVLVATASQDLGTGTYTILRQIAARRLGIASERVHVALGDSDLPSAPGSFGSMSAASVGPAVAAAADAVVEQLRALAAEDPRSPLHGCEPARIGLDDGELVDLDEPLHRVGFAELLTRTERATLAAEHLERPALDDEHCCYSFGAIFARVAVDLALGDVRVERMVGAFDIGRVLNPVTARSQLVGGMIFGIGMALMEEAVIDERNGRTLTPDLGGYLLPVNADVHRIEALFVDEPDLHFNALGVRGAGEIGNAGPAAAIANAVCNATGVRVRDLPILPERLLA